MHLPEKLTLNCLFVAIQICSDEHYNHIKISPSHRIRNPIIVYMIEKIGTIKQTQNISSPIIGKAMINSIISTAFL